MIHRGLNSDVFRDQQSGLIFCDKHEVGVKSKSSMYNNYLHFSYFIVSFWFSLFKYSLIAEVLKLRMS